MLTHSRRCCRRRACIYLNGLNRISGFLGCSANIIAAISGHASLGEVSRYTNAADQARLAREGVSMLIAEAKRRTETVKPERRFHKEGK